MRILFCHEYPAPGQEALVSLLPGHDIVNCSRDSVADHLEGVDVLVPFIATISRSVIECGAFGLIQQFGVGLDIVDIEAATAAGVQVAYMPAAATGNADSVAELTLLHMLLLARRWKETQAAFAARRTLEPLGTTLRGKVACLVGLGDLGSAIAWRLAALGMRLIGVRRQPELGGPDGVPFQRIVGMDALHEVLHEADHVVLCLPATSETYHLFNAQTLAAMKPGAFLINVGRGALVDQEALLTALRSGHVAGAGLDVFWEEPVDPGHPLFRENVIATPHIGGITDTSFRMRARAFADNIERYAKGAPVQYVVNKPAQLRASVSRK